jgi:thiol-disulfide isomerase/thioredoxin
MRRMLAPVLALALAAPAIVVAEGIGVGVGDVPPAALGQDRHGNVVDLEQERGKVVILTFWATWCPPCRAELGMLDRLSQIMPPERLSIVAVNLKEDRRTVARFLRQARDSRIRFMRASTSPSS